LNLDLTKKKRRKKYVYEYNKWLLKTKKHRWPYIYMEAVKIYQSIRFMIAAVPLLGAFAGTMARFVDQVK